jgi:Uma2 family endonuclease
MAQAPMTASTLTITDPSLTIPADVFGLDGFLRWVHSADFPAGRRASFLAGEVTIEMSPEEIVTHNAVKRDLSADLTMWNRRHRLGQVMVDRALLVHEPTGLSTEPDLMFCRSETLRSGRAQLAEKVEGSGRFVEVRGSPDLVVEIVSDSSVRQDTVVLPELYFVAGVKEYWLIDARRPRLSFRVFARGRKRFAAVKPNAEGYCSSQVLQGAFRLVRKKDPGTGVEYRLLAKK